MTLALAFSGDLHAQGREALPSIIPFPAQLMREPGSLDLSRGLRIQAPSADADAESAAQYFADLNEKTHFVLLRSKSDPVKAPSIMFVRRPALVHDGVDESYALKITPEGVRIASSGHAGFFYGVVTLWQMMSPNASSLPDVSIEDSPRFRWRGFMLDSARHVQSEEFVLQLLDYMAQHKMNIFHWHLVDDQGWRIEIKRYPKLTSVGAWRGPIMPPWQGGGEAQKPYGGFFTQEQIRRIVAYAKVRNITVVPEIEMPGHSTAAIAAYPQFGSAPNLPASPGTGWGIFPNLYNVDDATFEFLKNVLSEIMDLFPSEYIHIGGDEAIKQQWKSNAQIQARMLALGIHDEDQLQSWFVQRIEKFLNSRRRRMVGWDEILQGGLAPNATVMSWRDVQGGINAAKQGHDAVLTPSRPLYFNYRQSDSAREPPGRVPLNLLSDVYQFDAAPSSLTVAEQKHVIGVEACLWTEYVISQERVEHMLFPRIAALAEMAWTPPAQRNFQGFLIRLPAELDRNQAVHLQPAESVFEVRANVTTNNDGSRGQLTLSTQGGIGTIHYTLDGSAVTKDSSSLAGPVEVTFPSTLKAQAFDGSTALGSAVEKTLTLHDVLRRDSRELDQCDAVPQIQLEQDPIRNAERPVFRISYQRPCWIYKNVPMQLIQSFAVGVGSIPYIFHSASSAKPDLKAAESGPDPRLEIRLDGCDSKLLTTIDVAPAVNKDGVTELRSGPVPHVEGEHDVCFIYRSSMPNVVWLVNYIQPLPLS